MINEKLENKILTLAEKIKADKLILFLGAGFSRNFEMPCWEELLKEKVIPGLIKLNKNNQEEINRLNAIKKNFKDYNLSKILDFIIYNNIEYEKEI